MKAMLVGIGLFVFGFSGVALFSGGLPAALFAESDGASARDKHAPGQPVTLGDYGDAVEAAYGQMLIACSQDDREFYGHAMNDLAVAKRHADTGKIERGNIGDRASRMMTQFVTAVRKGIITNEHVPFGSLRTVIASVQKKAAAGKPQPEPTASVLRGSIGDTGAARHNDCQVL